MKKHNAVFLFNILRFGGWFGTTVSVLGLCAVVVLSRTYMGAGARSEATLSRYVRHLGSELEKQQVSSSYVLDHIDDKFALLVGDIIDYLRLLCLALLMLLALSVAVLDTLRKGRLRHMELGGRYRHLASDTDDEHAVDDMN